MLLLLLHTGTAFILRTGESEMHVGICKKHMGIRIYGAAGSMVLPSFSACFHRSESGRAE